MLTRTWNCSVFCSKQPASTSAWGNDNVHNHRRAPCKRHVSRTSQLHTEAIHLRELPGLICPSGRQCPACICNEGWLLLHTSLSCSDILQRLPTNLTLDLGLTMLCLLPTHWATCSGESEAAEQSRPDVLIACFSNMTPWVYLQMVQSGVLDQYSSMSLCLSLEASGLPLCPARIKTNLSHMSHSCLWPMLDL